MIPEEIQPHHRSGRVRKSAGGRKKSLTARSVRLVVTVYPEDGVDLDVLCDAWDVPMSTLVWALVHDYLQRARGVSSDLGDARGSLRLAMELALRDRELGPWLRREIGLAPQG